MIQQLIKFTKSYFKNQAAGSVVQIPLASATVAVYKQGATVASGTTVTTAGGGVAVSVRHKGRLEVGDTVQLGTDATKQMVVASITNETSVNLQSTIGSSIVVTAGDRLVIYSALPTLYPENTGIATALSNPTVTNSVGLVEFYTAEPIIDVIVSASGITPSLYADEMAGRTTQVSADRGDASVTLVYLTDSEIQRFATTLTANRTITLPTTNVVPGAHYRIIRTGLGAFTLAVGSLITIPANTSATVDIHYDGSNWRLTGYSNTSTGTGAVGSTADLVSSDRGDASVTLVYLTDNEIQRFATTLTANRTVTLSSTNAVNGARFLVVRSGLGAFTLDVGGLVTIPASTAAIVDVRHDGTAWRLTGYSFLSAFPPALVSADRGDTGPTLTYLVDSEIQRFATALTANRVITLSTTNAVNGSKFRVVRTGGGSFTLDVGGVKTIGSAVSGWVDVVYNGSAWVLSGSGTNLA